MVTSKHVQPEVIRSFASKFSKNWDVRYNMLCEVRSTAQQIHKQGLLQVCISPTHTALVMIKCCMLNVSPCYQHSHRLTETVEQEWQQAEPTDALLCALLAVPAWTGEEASSWCGGLEQNIVQDAPNPREGSKARRKRKRLEENEGKDKPSGPKTLWASPAAQVAAYRQASLVRAYMNAVSCATCEVLCQLVLCATL